MTKKSTSSTTSTKTAKGSSVAEAAAETSARSSLPDPFGRLHFGDWFDRWPEVFGRRWPERLEGLPFAESGFRIEQFMDDDTLIVRSELPGVDPDDDVKITVSDDVLTIGAEREERSKEERNGGYHTEFHYGSLRRSVRLPMGSQVDKITAGYADGILEVKVPIDEDASDVVTVPVRRGG